MEDLWGDEEWGADDNQQRGTKMTMKQMTDVWKEIQEVDPTKVVRLFKEIEKTQLAPEKGYFVLSSDYVWGLIDKLHISKWSWNRICGVLNKVRIRRDTQKAPWNSKGSASWFNAQKRMRRKKAIRQAGSRRKPTVAAAHTPTPLYERITKLHGQRKTWARITKSLNNEGLLKLDGTLWKGKEAKNFFWDRKNKKVAPKVTNGSGSSNEVTVVRPANGRTILLFDDVQLDIEFVKNSFNIEALWVKAGKVSSHTLRS